ncbi:MAG: hypothetical protein JW395_2031 [Nitrospira sp.]|nr:hypothetical protein [Nitrospira sp.]
METDLTAAEKSKSKAKFRRPSAVISSPARLLKLLKPSLAFISKNGCNPLYQPAKLVDVRVPLGAEQAKLYAHFLNRGNIPCNNALVRARKQIAYLRGICADPAGFRFGGPHVSSNFNPKLLTALELIREIIAKGEQVNVICARVGQTDTLHALLHSTGIATSRIDSTVEADQHQAQARRFKSGETQVMLMGIKCAAGHSFSNVMYEIILSLEYSFGTLHQARGRIDRVNSRPGVTIYCILHKDSIEEAMFDKVATKEDAATICLRGQRVPREFHPVDPGEVLADNVVRWENASKEPGKEIQVRAERDCINDWPELCDELKIAVAKGREDEAPFEFEDEVPMDFTCERPQLELVED